MNRNASPRHETVALLTLGCAKNVVDSEHIASLLEANGIQVGHDPARSRVAIVNTCSFIQDAKEESIEIILDAADLKEDGALEALIVTGCLSERYGPELEESLPEVDVFVGLDPQEAALAALRALGMAGDMGCIGPELRGHRLTPAAWSYLRIAEGCDNRCAYCAIPDIRGPLRSRNPDEILAEARYLVGRGVRELNIIAQDTAAYGMDRNDLPSAPDLLERLCDEAGAKWIRLLYAHPAHIGDDLIEVVAGRGEVCPYVDMPLQHISDQMLRRMGRGIRRVAVEELIERVRERIPGVTLRTTFLLGFPGETDEDFEELLAFVEGVRFDRAGCFAYSREEGTPAAEFPDQVPAEVARERCDELMAAQQEVAFDLAEERVGGVTEVLMEEGEAEDGLRPARSAHEAPDVDPVVYIEPPAPPPGEFATVRITESNGYDWVARTVKGEADEPR